jgi:hypothetical protein
MARLLSAEFPEPAIRFMPAYHASCTRKNREYTLECTESAWNANLDQIAYPLVLGLCHAKSPSN